MPRIIPEQLVDVVVGALAGAIDVDDGGTDAQRRVLSALASIYWGRTDFDLGAVERLSPEQAASAIVDPLHRRRFRELMVLLELCRHPLTDEQVRRVDAYAEAVGEEGPGLMMARDIVREGSERAMADFMRFYPEAKRSWSEDSMMSDFEELEEPDPQLALGMLALHDLPEGSLGWEFVEFYRRNGLELPGVSVQTPAFFFAHDMNHIIAGYEPVGVDEVALSAMILGTEDSDEHWMLMLTSMAAYEVGILGSDEFEAKSGIFEREGTAEVFAEALRRGAACTAPFANADHWALAEWQLEDVRADFGVPERTI